MSLNDAYTAFIESFPGTVVRNEPLKNHTTIRIGGPADLFCEIHTPGELLPVLKTARGLKIPAILIGSGSNLLVDDAGYRGLIVKFVNQSPPELDFPLLTVSAGNMLGDVLAYAEKHSLSGLEFLAGIPGTLGGAVYMNAGAYGKTISELLHRAVIVSDSYELQTVDPGFFRFRYRSSILQDHPETIVSVTVKISRGDAAAIREEYDRILALRAEKHPKPETPCAGSYFKNLPPERPGDTRRPAGYFLDKAGVKSIRAGGAAVYGGHANIIINTGDATAQDVLLLARKMKDAVFEKFRIKLTEEVRYLDAERGILTPEDRERFPEERSLDFR